MKKKLVIVSLCTLILALWPGCKKAKKTKGKAGSKETLTLVSDPQAAAGRWLPANRRDAKFVLVGKARVYDQQTVYELVNGGADALLDAGLKSLLHVRIKDGAGVFTDLEIQVMDVSSPRQAVALLMKEKGPEARAVKLADRAFAERGAVLFAKGRYLVRVNAMPTGKRPFAPVAEVARQVAATPGARWK